MEEFTATATSWAGVKGATMINHRLRLQLNISLVEYIMLDFVYNFSTKYPKIAFTDEDIFKETGYHFDSKAQQIFKILREQGLIEIVAGQTMIYRTTEVWNKLFDVDAEFLEFWNDIYKKHGNKVDAREKYMQCRKLIDKETLHKKAIEYISIREDFPAFTKAAEVWLNPKKRNWENEYNIQPIAKKEAKPKMNF